ncbi:MAG: hypothetical protein MUO58_01000 [Anaerolineales bacterium]|nr:hypothetical protein [Anaerolineales bacterium]
MSRFLIEVPHENKKEACERAVQVFLESGSHFVTNADWGCHDDEHKAWFVVDLDNKEEARAILPPHFRQDAKIIALEKFTMDDLEGTMEQHND